MENNMKIEIDAKLINVSTIRLAIASFISNLKITLDEIVEIKTVFAESNSLNSVMFFNSMTSPTYCCSDSPV